MNAPANAMRLDGDEVTRKAVSFKRGRFNVCPGEKLGAPCGRNTADGSREGIQADFSIERENSGFE